MKINKILAAGIAATLAVTSLSAVVGAETKTAEFEMATSEATFKTTLKVAYFKDNKDIISGRLAAAADDDTLSPSSAVKIGNISTTQAEKIITAITDAIDDAGDTIDDKNEVGTLTTAATTAIDTINENLEKITTKDETTNKYPTMKDAQGYLNKAIEAVGALEALVDEGDAANEDDYDGVAGLKEAVIEEDTLVVPSTAAASIEVDGPSLVGGKVYVPASTATINKVGAATNKELAAEKTITLDTTNPTYVWDEAGAVIVKLVPIKTVGEGVTTLAVGDLVKPDAPTSGGVAGTNVPVYTPLAATVKLYVEDADGTALLKDEDKKYDAIYSDAAVATAVADAVLLDKADLATATGTATANLWTISSATGIVKGGEDAAKAIQNALKKAKTDSAVSKLVAKIEAIELEAEAAAANEDAGDIFVQGGQITIDATPYAIGDQGNGGLWKDLAYVPVSATMTVTGKPTDSNTQVTKTYEFADDDKKAVRTNGGKEIKTGGKILTLNIVTDRNIANKKGQANLNVFDKITDCEINVTFEHQTADEDIYKVNNGATVSYAYQKFQVGWEAGEYATDDCKASDHAHIGFTLATTPAINDAAEDNMTKFMTALKQSDAYRDKKYVGNPEDCRAWVWFQPSTDMKEYMAFLEKTTENTIIYRDDVKVLSFANAYNAGTASINEKNTDWNHQTFYDANNRGTAPRYFGGLASQVADFFNKKNNGKITFQFSSKSATSSWKNGGVPSTEVGLKNALAGTSMGLFFNYNQSTGSLQTLGEVDSEAGTITFDISEILDDMGGLTKGNISDIFYGLNKGIEYKSNDYESIHATNDKSKVGKIVDDVEKWYYSTQGNVNPFAIGYLVEKVTLSYEDGDVDAATDTDTDTDAAEEDDTDAETVEDTDDDEDEDEDDDAEDEDDDYEDDDDDADDDMDDDDVADDDDTADDDLSDDDLADDDLAEDDDDIVEDDAADDIAIEDDDIDAVIDQDDTAETDVENDVDVIVVPTTTDDDANPGTGVGLAVIPAIVAAAAIAVSKKRK